MQKNSLVLLLVLFILNKTLAQSDERTHHFHLKKGVAIYGYDPLSYFGAKPERGKPIYTYKYLGVVYYFSNQANVETFKKNPEKYEPAYGGWCAYAMGNKAEKVDIDPENYKIIAGKVYLFYKNFFNNTLNDWNENEKKLKSQADKNWLSILKK